SGGRLSLGHLLDEVDASARPVELVAEQLVGRAGGSAETAMHAFAQDGFGFLPVGRALEPVCEMGFHVRRVRFGSEVRVAELRTSEVRIHAAGVEDAARVEFGL